jgi:hypothetical protein
MEEKVISLEEISNIAKGEVISIPGWKRGTTINVRVKPIDVTPRLAKMRAGIPNPLKKDAEEVFEGTEKEQMVKAKTTGEEVMAQASTQEALTEIATEALVEPTYEAISKIMPLTTDQKLAIYLWLLGGVQQLSPFREEPLKGDKPIEHGKTLRSASK